jgi:hypothetical protein
MATSKQKEPLPPIRWVEKVVDRDGISVHERRLQYLTEAGEYEDTPMFTEIEDTTPL